MITLRQDGIQKVRSGLTTIEEIYGHPKIGMRIRSLNEPCAKSSWNTNPRIRKSNGLFPRYSLLRTAGCSGIADFSHENMTGQVRGIYGNPICFQHRFQKKQGIKECTRRSIQGPGSEAV